MIGQYTTILDLLAECCTEGECKHILDHLENDPAMQGLTDLAVPEGVQACVHGGIIEIRDDDWIAPGLPSRLLELDGGDRCFADEGQGEIRYAFIIEGWPVALARRAKK